jgi:hypothetical protein
MEEKETEIKVDLDQFIDTSESLAKDIEAKYTAKIYIGDKKESTEREIK